MKHNDWSGGNGHWNGDNQVDETRGAPAGGWFTEDLHGYVFRQKPVAGSVKANGHAHRKQHAHAGWKTQRQIVSDKH